MSVTQKCIENIYFYAMPITTSTLFKFNCKNGSKGHPIERGVRNLHDRIRKVQVYSILIVPFSCILAHALFTIINTKWVHEIGELRNV